MVRILIYISSFALILSLMSCTSSKIIFNEKISNTERLKIAYQYYRDHRTFTLLLRENDEFVKRIEIMDSPRYAITKTNLSKDGGNYSYYLVTDTTQFNLKCLEFTFGSRSDLSTFQPLDKSEALIFAAFSKVLMKEEYGVKLSEQEAKKFIGWVKIYWR